MNFEQSKYKIIKTPEIKVKEGVDFVFDQNPELANIGTQEQYSAYLETIFPNSKVKDIVYHRTDTEFLDFDKSKTRSGGLYFNFNKDRILSKKIIPVILNLTNPIVTATNFTSLVSSKTNNRNFNEQTLREASIDGAIGVDNFKKLISFSKEGELIFDENIILSLTKKLTNSPLDRSRVEEIVVFGSDQIHTLGSKHDIEKFKKFVSRSKLE